MMDEQDKKNIEDIKNAVNEIREIMKKPENKARKVFEFIGLLVTIFSSVSIADVIIKWLIGG